MRLGVYGLLPHVPEVTAADAGAVAAAGFNGVGYMIDDPLLATRAELEGVRDVLADAGVRIAQANARYNVLVDPDEGRRRAGIAVMQRSCSCARWLDAASLYVRPGSLNPCAQWGPHPQNTAPATIERLIDSLREIASTAVAEGVVLALEGHIVSPLDSAERVRQVLAAVDSPALRFNMDPVNFVGTLLDAYATTDVVNHLFDVLGPWVVAAHAKDLYVEDRHVLHLSECVPGAGLLDQETFLRRFEACCPDGYVLIEHLADAQIPQAQRAINVAAARAGVTWQ